MIYFLYGNDTKKSRAKLHELLGVLSAKRPNAEVFRITTENWSEGQFDELLSSQGLFDQKYIVILDNVFEEKVIKEYILARVEDAAGSDQIFLMIEAKMDATAVKKIETAAAKVQEFTLPEGSKEKFNIFSITDGLKEKDKKKLWISYVDLLRKGAGVEEIHGILFWQVKNMLIASKADSQKETGLAPFPYKSALSGSRKYKVEELHQLSSDLVEMTHKVRKGQGDLEVMLEKWILQL